MSNINYAGLKIYESRTPNAREFNRLVDYVQSITLNQGLNYRVKRTPNGTTLVATGGNPNAEVCPFTVTTAAATDDSGNIVVSVRAGTVNSLLPSNNFDTFTVDPTQVIQVKAHVLTDGAAVTSCTLVVDDTAPAAQEPTPFALPSIVDVLIAVIVNGTPYRVIGCGSIQLTGTAQFQTNPSSPAPPGTLNYVQYYSWTVGVV